MGRQKRRAAIGLLVPLAMLPLQPIEASATPAKVAVSTTIAADSWYRVSVQCGTPLGCPTDPSAYPAGTRHVGVELGSEESRSYLQLDLSAVPAGSTLVGGRLTVPIATTQDGSATPEVAKIQACASFADLVPADGTYTNSPPAPACETAAAPGTYVPAAAAHGAAFTFDLGPLAGLWTGAVQQGTLALVPQPGAALIDSWHVAFSAGSRKGATPAPSAALEFLAGAPVPAPSPRPSAGPTQRADDSIPVALPGLGAVQVTAPLPSASALPSIVIASQPASQAMTSLEPVAVVLPRFRYPGVFVLPFILAAVAVWLARALTREL